VLAPEGTAEPKEVLIRREHPTITPLRQYVPAYPKEENQVKRHKIIWALGLTLLLSLALAACAQPTATEAPATEVVVEPTEEPVVPTEEVMAFEGMKVEAPDCDYGGILKSIEAVDAYTVVFTTCVRSANPCFPARNAAVAPGSGFEGATQQNRAFSGARDREARPVL
jgi:hypothetical protein